MKKAILIGLIFVVLLSGCSTVVTIETEPKGAKVYINNAPKGETPYTQRLSNFIFESYSLRLKLDGYEDIYTTLDKEIKVGPALGGLFLGLIPWLWIYGPVDYQYYELVRE